jgi:hypothetical protein
MWKRAGYERGAYWAQSETELKGFAVKPNADEAVYQANRRQAQRARDVFIRVENKKLA